MSQLLVRNIEASLVKKLKMRAAEKGLSAEEEHRRILKAALEGEPSAPRHAEYTFKDHLMALGELSEDTNILPPRQVSKRRKVEL